jgi:hypothetical protein
MGRRARTGRLIVKRTRMLQPLPRMEAARGQSQEPQDSPQRHKLTGPIHSSQDSNLRASIGQTLVGQRESRAAKQGESEPKERRQLPHASPERHDLLLEFGCPQVRHVQGDDDLRGLAEPATGRRARNPEIHGDGHVRGAADETRRRWS